MRSFVVLSLLLLVGSARADDLVRARELEAKLEYEQALTIVDTILARGGAEPARYIELHLFAGRLAAGLERFDIARDHFARVLAVRPETVLPDGTSPKLTVPFAAARAKSTPLVVRVVVARGSLALETTDPLGLITGVSVHAIANGKPIDLVERAGKRLAVPDGASVTDVAALDAAGNRVWVGTPPSQPPIANRPIETRRPLYARWASYAVLGGVALGVGVVGAWRFDSAQDRWNRLRAEGNTDFSELEAIERRGRRWGIAANVGFGIAAASAIVAAIVGVRTRDDRPVVVPTGSGLALTGRF